MESLSPILVVFGAPNSPGGELLSVAKSRADLCIRLAREMNQSKIVLTGGFGDHFNVSKNPHWQYVESYITKNGIDPARITGRLNTENTYSDIEQLQTFLSEKKYYGPLILITSEFHTARVSLLSSRLLRHPFCIFGARTPSLHPIEDIFSEELKKVVTLLNQ